jgi:hypothetical protein
MPIDKEFQKKVGDYLEELRKDLLMEHWSVHVHFESKDTTKDGLRVAATVTPTYHYYVAEMHIYPYLREMTLNNDALLVEALTHELIHCITHEIFYMAQDRYITPPELNRANERLTQHITRIIRWKHDKAGTPRPQTGLKLINCTNASMKTKSKKVLRKKK